MGDNEAIVELINTLKGFKPGGALKNYINYVVFPKFKNLEPGTRVDFSFPFTALVGANGIGKSSLLHAMWGMPYGYSTSKFWFSTELDPIQGGQKDPQRYFYGHWSESFGDVVETRKARVGQKKGADYWEPARRSGPDGMMELPAGEYEGKAKDRWHPPKRKVEYINLKTAFGSFDRYFYFDENLTGGDKRDVMMREAKRLKSIIANERTSYKLGGHERLFENRMLNNDELAQVSRILGRDYDAARLVRHSLYPGNRGRDLSDVFDRGVQYSEAFAGSGEIAAVSAVVQILGADGGSLILLDEPETSLHPGAQRAFMRFLLEQIKLKKHQVVVSTHSAEFVDGLPHDAIKVFEDNGKGQSRILPRSSPFAALRRLGKPPANMRRVLVEDGLAELIVLRAAKGLDEGDAAVLEVRVAPGGAEAILMHLGPGAMLSGDEVFVLLDGDKRKVDAFSDPQQITPAEHQTLPALLKKELGVEPMLHIPGGKDDAGHQIAKTNAQLEYLTWLRKHVAYLPRKVPEHIVLEALDPGHDHGAKASAEAKAALRVKLADGADADLSAADFLALAKVRIAKIPLDNLDLVQIRTQLQTWLHG
jgi:predicted ATPase